MSTEGLDKYDAEMELRADLPKTNVGKVLRRALRDEEQRLRGEGRANAVGGANG